MVCISQHGLKGLTRTQRTDAGGRSCEHHISVGQRRPGLQIGQQLGRRNGHRFNRRGLADIAIDAQLKVKA